MALADLIRKGVSIVNKQTKSVQVTVTHKQWTKQDGFGSPVYDPPEGIARLAILDQRYQLRTRSDGQTVPISASLNFLDPILPKGTEGREEPIDARDVIVLPDGSSNSIVNIEGPYDPAMGKPFILTVWLGSK